MSVKLRNLFFLARYIVVLVFWKFYFIPTSGTNFCHRESGQKIKRDILSQMDQFQNMNTDHRGLCSKFSHEIQKDVFTYLDQDPELGQCQGWTTSLAKRTATIVSNWCSNEKLLTMDNNHTNEESTFLADFFAAQGIAHVQLLHLDNSDVAKQLKDVVLTLSSKGLFSNLAVVPPNETKPNFAIFNNTGYVILNDTPVLLPILKQFESKSYMDFGNIWLVKLPKTASFNLVPLELSFTSQLYTFHAINTGEIIVKEVFRVEDHGPINVQTLGKWSTRFGFQYQSESARYLRNRRTDLGGINFLCAMEHDPPYLLLKPNPPESPKQFEISGYQYDVWMELGMIANFTTSYVKSIDGNWGSLQPNGSFDGMIGMIERKEVDCAVSGFGLMKERSRVADYLNPTGYLSNTLYIKNVQGSSGGTLYFKPFSTWAWLCIFVLILALVAVIFLGLRSGQNQETKVGTWSFKSGFFVTTSIVTGQGIPDYADTNSSGMKVVFACALMFGLVLNLFYSATLTSHLAAKKEIHPFTDDKSLYYDSNYKVVTVSGSGYVDFYKDGTEMQQRIFKERMVLAPSISDAFDVMNSTLDHAFYWMGLGITAITKGSCEFKPISTMTTRTPLTIYYRKNWKYGPLLNYLVSRLRQSGGLHKIAKQSFIEQKQNCNQPKMESPGWDKVFMLFSLLGLGVIFAFLLMFIEVLTIKCN